MPVSDLVALFEADDGDGLLAALSGLSDDMRAQAWETLRRPLCAVLGPQDRQTCPQKPGAHASAAAP